MGGFLLQRPRHSRADLLRSRERRVGRHRPAAAGHEQLRPRLADDVRAACGYRAAVLARLERAAGRGDVYADALERLLDAAPPPF